LAMGWQGSIGFCSYLSLPQHMKHGGPVNRRFLEG
jgi:hypothetical protein